MSVFSSNHNDGLCKLPIVTLVVGDTAIPNVSVRILHYDGKFDVEANWSTADLPEPAEWSIAALHRKAQEIATRYEIESYFAGLDPASDEDTRFFTGRSLGPFQLG
jgi:hypothetical protein